MENRVLNIYGDSVHPFLIKYPLLHLSVTPAALVRICYFEYDIAFVLVLILLGSFVKYICKFKILLYYFASMF